MLAQLLSAKVAAIAAVTVLGATAAAAATNTLPDAAQTVVSDAVSHVGVSVPKPNSHANAHATAPHGKPDNPGKAGNATGPDATGSAKYGLCTAHAAGPTTTNPHSQKNSSVVFSNLQKAADNAGMSVAEFCKDATPPPVSTPSPSPHASQTGLGHRPRALIAAARRDNEPAPLKDRRFASERARQDSNLRPTA